jgi:electron transfer flavoprotein alpha subunit
MDTILVLLHTEEDGSLRRAALEAVSVAGESGQPFTLGLVGGSIGGALAQLAGCGAVRTLAVQGGAFAASRYSTDAAAAQAICEAVQPGVVLAPGTSRWSRALPGVAHRLSGAADTHITGVTLADGEVEASRWFYRQRIEGSLRRSQRPWFLLMDGGVAAPYAGEGAPLEAVSLAVEATSRTEVAGMVSPQTGEQTIRPEAEVLFVAGAGWTKKQKDGQAHVREAGELILGFVRKTESSLGSSKSLVDLSGEGHAVLPFLSHLNQVGQTGSTPRHPKGLATCCHGEEPHVVGWRFIQDRRAVNLDANCGWARGKADVLYVADAFAVMTRVNELLSKE